LKNELFVNVIYTLQGSMMTLISWFSWQLVHCLSIVSVSLSLPVCLLGGVWHLRSSQSVDLASTEAIFPAQNATQKKRIQRNSCDTISLQHFY